MKTVVSVAVCDDDVSVLDVIAGATKNAFHTHGIRAEAACFSSVAAMEKAMKNRKFDLLLLDIDMPGEDGIQFGKRLQKERSMLDVVFVSNREDRMYDAFVVHPFGFVRKSNFLKDIVEVAEAYIASRSDENARCFVVQTRGQTLSLPVGDILYFEGSRKNQLIYMKGEGEPVQITLSMKKLEEDFSSKGFLRVHSGYLVNYQHIRRLAADGVTLDDGRKLPISRRKYQEIKVQFMEFAAQEDTYIF